MSIASGTVGLAHYATFIWPSVTGWGVAALAGAICLLNTGLLWRDVRSIQRLSITVSVIVIAACLWMNSSGLNQGTSGNISVRHGDTMLISPSGVPY